MTCQQICEVYLTDVTEECAVSPCDDQSHCLNEAACSLSTNNEYHCHCIDGYTGLLHINTLVYSTVTASCFYDTTWLEYCVFKDEKTTYSYIQSLGLVLVCDRPEH